MNIKNHYAGLDQHGCYTVDPTAAELPFYPINVGDVFRLSDGRNLLFDWSNGLQFGFLISDGESGGMSYLNSLERFIKDHGGIKVRWFCRWPHDQQSPSREASILFLNAGNPVGPAPSWTARNSEECA